MIWWVEDVGNNDDGLGGFKEAAGYVSFSELPPTTISEARIERFNSMLGYAGECIKKGPSDPAKFVLAAMCLDFVQYKESDALMKNAAYKQRFDSTADKLEKYSMDFGAVCTTVDKEKYMRK